MSDKTAVQSGLPEVKPWLKQLMCHVFCYISAADSVISCIIFSHHWTVDVTL